MQCNPGWGPGQSDSCTVDYKFFFDSFQIRGEDWTDNTLGANGEGLLDALHECGSVTGWSFTRTPNDPQYGWVASGSLPIGVKSCVGSAVVKVGGPSVQPDGCVGAG